jgi:hypothetical protein
MPVTDIRSGAEVYNATGSTLIPLFALLTFKGEGYCAIQVLQRLQN